MNYVAYTLGPIYDTIFDTLNGDHKTKKLKAGSYYFSLFMKTLLINIKDEFDVLVPYVGAEALVKEHKMGLFHDRFIAQSEKSKSEIRDILSNKLELTFKKMAENIKDESIAFELMNNMTNHSIIASADELKEIDQNIIFALNKILDSKEQQRDFESEVKKNWISQYQENEIKNSKVKTIEELSEKLGFKYYAVITADGDKIGAKIKDEATDDPMKIKDLSEKLYKFFTDGKDIHTITNYDFGGELIYAGGDDILAFLPVKFEDKTFLDYISVLDKRFKEIVGNDVSLSFGVNIAYYKYPLRNAINSSLDLLDKAKENKNIKNRISIKITKHSGQWFSSTLALQDERYQKYNELVNGILTEKVTLPHSLHHSLKRYKEAILATYQYPNGSVKAMFTTIFNDTKSDKDKNGLELVREYLDLFRPQINNDFDDIFSQLSIIKFLRGDRE
ncbi:MAG: type III-B CRISPR-associated protein Cas10/Cmr2 [Campylobacteraceae bacterium]|nr:type III-B CRISPR-associated protein Cas10/Cmr2 [Campylobacteraceae bacterium]